MMPAHQGMKSCLVRTLYAARFFSMITKAARDQSAVLRSRKTPTAGGGTQPRGPHTIVRPVLTMSRPPALSPPVGCSGNKRQGVACPWPDSASDLRAGPAPTPRRETLNGNCANDDAKRGGHCWLTRQSVRASRMMQRTIAADAIVVIVVIGVLVAISALSCLC
jgi:hypothetical protein